MNYSKLLRTLRQRRFAYCVELEDKLDRVLKKVKQKAMKQEADRPKTRQEIELAEKRYRQDYFKYL